MAEYINMSDLEIIYCRKGCAECKNEMCLDEMLRGLPTIDIPDTGIEFETPREQLAFICGAILEKQKRNGERRTDE